MPKPLLPWVGGKSRCVIPIVNQFPTEMESYHEPFVGGGSILFQVLHAIDVGRMRVKNVYASDTNMDLIHMYIQVQQSPFDVLRHLQHVHSEWARIPLVHGNQHPTNLHEAQSSKESYYYWIRAEYNAMSDEERMSPLRAAYFMFLTRTGLRGGVGFGHMDRVTMVDEDHIRTIHHLIRPVLFQVQPYHESLARVNEGDMVYLDPPSIQNGFSIANTRDLVRTVHDLPCRWKLSPSSDTLDLFHPAMYSIVPVGPRPADILISPLPQRA